MTAEYDFTRDDFSVFNDYHFRNSPAARRQYLRGWFGPAVIWLIFCIVVWGLAVSKRGAPLETFLNLKFLFGGVPIYLACFPIVYRRAIGRCVNRMINEGQNRELFSRHHLSISPDAITLATANSHSSMGWRAIEKVAMNGDYAYLYVSAISAIIIPRRAFTDPAGFEEFVFTVKQYHEKASA